MYRKIVGIFICLLLIASGFGSLFGFIKTTKADPGDVILSFDAPANYTCGLAWDGEYLWNIVFSFSVQKLFKLDPTDGGIILSFNVHDEVPWNPVLTWDGEYLWSATDICLGDFQNHLYKIDPSDGTIITSFEIPSESSGLAWDGEYLWMVSREWDGDVYHLLLKINPLDGTVINSMVCPGNNPRGLAWDGEYLWIADPDYENLENGYIYKISPSDGSIITSVNSPGPIPFGLAWDGEYLWVADYLQKKIYKVDVGGSEEESDIVINEITGGFGIKAVIKNNGTTSATNISWSIDVEPGFGLILSGEHTLDVIDKLASGDLETIQSNSLRGIGFITIIVQAADAIKPASAFLLGPLVLRVVEV